MPSQMDNVELFLQHQGEPRWYARIVQTLDSPAIGQRTQVDMVTVDQVLQGTIKD